MSKQGDSVSSRPTFHAQRMQTLGMLASGIAHDFNNILTGVLGHVTYLKTIIGDEKQLQESLEAIEGGAKRASAMTSQILNFSRLESSDQNTQIDLIDVVQKTEVLLRGAISPQIDIQCQVPEAPLPVFGTEAKLAQILVNLVVNARDALENVKKASIKIRVYSKEDTVILTVHDNGSGMSPEVIEQAFNPYFSTKGEQGNGLGLYTVRSIVQELGGAIRVSSCPDNGTEFQVTFGIASGDGIPELPIVDSLQPVEKSESKTILVIEDEESVRGVLQMSLQHLGYRVYAAASGEEGIETLSNSSKEIDLVIVDMLMPGISGAEVYEHVQENYKDIPVVLMSGYSSEDSIRKIKEKGSSVFLQKPFTIETLSEAIAKVLA